MENSTKISTRIVVIMREIGGSGGRIRERRLQRKMCPIIGSVKVSKDSLPNAFCVLGSYEPLKCLKTICLVFAFFDLEA